MRFQQELDCARPARVRASSMAWHRLFSTPWEPLLIAHWDRVLMIHFEVEPHRLQPWSPFDLDVRGERAFVSLVAFTLRGMSFARGGRLGEWLLRPIATHEFLNVRTYVTHRGEPGILFLAEWLSSRLSVWLGPACFGLPYHHASIHYRHERPGITAGEVDAPDGALRFRATWPGDASMTRTTPGSVDEFLMERYTAFTARKAGRGFFRVWHKPWRQCRAAATLDDTKLLERRWPWFREARMIGANYSPGSGKVLMGWPHRIAAR